MAEPSRVLESSGATDRQGLWSLAWIGLVSWLVYVAIAMLSAPFAYGAPQVLRPVPAVLVLFAAAFVLHLGAIRVAVRQQSSTDQILVIGLFAVAFRMVLLFSHPILEIDLYRYLWDGEACVAGVSPYRYSPQQVLSADADGELPDDLRRLVERRDRLPAVQTILSRVHYGELTTVYPPVSQCVFALAAATAPSDANVALRVLIIRGWLVAFDLGTWLVLLWLLRQTGRSAGWSIAYAWCPLVLKEFANSGHLDAIAVFFCTAAVACLVRGLYSLRRSDGDDEASSALTGGVASWGSVSAAAVLLGLAVGAKLYPVVLVPLCALSVLWRGGLKPVVVTAVLFSLTAGISLWPMFAGQRPAAVPVPVAETEAELPPIPTDTDGSIPDPVAEPVETGAAEVMEPAGNGLQAFLSRWEMNDFLFLILVENLDPAGERAPADQPWFVVVPHAWRAAVVDQVAAWTGEGPSRATFLLARGVTAAVFVLLALWLAWRGAGAKQGGGWCEAAFLTLAWFWLLSPTLNPWYWTWALPLIPFARGRAWWAVSCVLLLYYLRFWLIVHWPASPGPLGMAYSGSRYFDFVVTWLEHAPWMLWLAGEAACRRWFPGACRPAQGE